MEKDKKQMKATETSYTIGQMDTVYRTMLQPIKLSISQILLYDTETASKFLNEYNDIIQSEDINIFNRIVELELEIESYQNGKEQKTYDSNQVKSIIQSINELDAKSYQLSAKELLESFLNIRQQYKDFGMHSFQARENIETKLYELQMKVIARTLKETPETTLAELIKEEDISGLKIAINGMLSQYLQSEDLREKNKAQKIVNMMAENRVIYSEVVWQLIDELQTGMHRSEARENIEQQQNTDTSMALTVRKQGTEISLVEKLSRKFSLQPQLPLQVEDLKKINVDWLTEYIPQEMLVQIEKERLKAEGKNPDKIFLPDIKTPIYDMIQKTIKERRMLVDMGEHSNFSFIDKTDGEEKSLSIKSPYLTYVTISYGDGVKQIQCSHGGEWFATAALYAEFIDNIFGTNWRNELLNEFANKCINTKSSETTFIHGKIYSALNKSYLKIFKRYQDEQLEFNGSESKKREHFYEKNKFRASIKQNGDTQVGSLEQKENIKPPEIGELE